MTKFTDSDPEALKSEQYRDGAHLGTRVNLHQAYSANSYGWHPWVFDRVLVAIGPTASVLEVGCGRADLWRVNADAVPAGWALTLTDFSSGMVDDARAVVAECGLDDRVQLDVADVADLQFDDGSFDAVIANHMLYHVPDRPKAIAQLARVVRAGGAVIATTNGERHLVELDALAMAHFPQMEPDDAAQNFGFVTGFSQLLPVFRHVCFEAYPDRLVVDEVEPIVDYVRSTSYGPSFTDAQISSFRSAVADHIGSFGAFVVTKEPGIFIARRGEGMPS